MTEFRCGRGGWLEFRNNPSEKFRSWKMTISSSLNRTFKAKVQYRSKLAHEIMAVYGDKGEADE